MEVNVSRETVEETPWRTFFAVQVDLGMGLTHRERAILFNAARCCEVHQLLAGDIAFDYRVLDD